jgi:tripartite-type tricarboxylate transporter receptor subunit TctC
MVPFKGKIQPIAVMTDKRFSLAPDLPSFRETLGRSGSVLEYYGGFALPSGTPTSIAENYYNTLSEAAKSPTLINRLAGQMTTADVAPGAELQRLVSTDLQQWGPIASELNLKAN